MARDPELAPTATLTTTLTGCGAGLSRCEGSDCTGQVDAQSPRVLVPHDALPPDVVLLHVHRLPDLHMRQPMSGKQAPQMIAAKERLSRRQERCQHKLCLGFTCVRRR